MYYVCAISYARYVHNEWYINNPRRRRRMPLCIHINIIHLNIKHANNKYTICLINTYEYTNIQHTQNRVVHQQSKKAQTPACAPTKISCTLIKCKKYFTFILPNIEYATHATYGTVVHQPSKTAQTPIYAPA